MKRIISYIFILLGIGIIGLWIMLLSTNQVPELETELASILLHIIIEILMGIMCIISGVFLLKNHTLQYQITIFTLGMVTYSVINSSGYYIHLGNYIMVVSFSMILSFSLFTLISLFKNGSLQ